MKVKVKRWHGVAVWKWEIDEEVRLFDMARFFLLLCQFVVDTLSVVSCIADGCGIVDYVGFCDGIEFGLISSSFQLFQHR